MMLEALQKLFCASGEAYLDKVDHRGKECRLEVSINLGRR